MLKKFLFISLLFGLIGCGRAVLVPPAIDLIPYEQIGLITFSVENAKGELDQIATQRFLQEITQYQRVPIVEMGKLEEVLGKIQKTSLDADAAKAIGENYGLKFFFHGKIKVSQVKPQVDLMAALQRSLRVRASLIFL